MGLFKMISEVMTALEKPPRPTINQRQQPAIPMERLKAMVAQGKRGEAIQLLVTGMNWSTARAEYFISDLERGATKGITKARAIGRNDTSTKIDRILRDQQAAEAMAGGSLFDYIKARLKLF
jgi:hypothetical protein